MEEILYTIIAAIAFLIPGFIITNLKKRVVPEVDKDYKTKIFENFIYSFLNIFLWSLPLYKIYSNFDFWKEKYFFLWIIAFIIIFVSPVTITLIIIICDKYDLFRKLCEYLKITSVDTEPSAWDFKFKNLKEKWVLVTLSNKRVVRGHLGAEKAFMSSNSKERDLYIDEVYRMNDKGEWIKREETDGIWIKNEEIRCIEFFNNVEGGDENEKCS